MFVVPIHQKTENEKNFEVVEEVLRKIRVYIETMEFIKKKTRGESREYAIDQLDILYTEEMAMDSLLEMVKEGKENTVPFHYRDSLGGVIQKYS